WGRSSAAFVASEIRYVAACNCCARSRSVGSRRLTLSPCSGMSATWQGRNGGGRAILRHGWAPVRHVRGYAAPAGSTHDGYAPLPPSGPPDTRHPPVRYSSWDLAAEARSAAVPAEFPSMRYDRAGYAGLHRQDAPDH